MHLIIVGCGRVGSELAHNVAEKGHDVVVVDRNPQAFQRLGHEFRGRTVQGDCRQREVLMRAGVEHADGLAAVTPSDELNLVVSRAASSLFDVPNVVARVYDPVHARPFELAGLQTVISSSWSAHRVEQLLTHPGLTELAVVGNGDVVLVEIRIPKEHVGRSSDDLMQTCQCYPTAYVRGGQARLISHDTVLEEDDLVVVAVEASDLMNLERTVGLMET
ncbi:MAG: NAD(P)-binding domain-containing protein [Anaerolineales bacterium]|nr:NAD(P)-binding domain-containing protein [Anaerolineales bacterium]